MEIERPERFRLMSLGLPVDRLERICPDWQRLSALAFGRDAICTRIFSGTVKSMMEHGDEVEDSVRNCLGDAAISLLGGVLREHAGRSEQVAPVGAAASSRLEFFHRERIKRFIRENLCHSELDIAMIAQGVGLSPRYIHRLFEKEPLRLMQWVWEQRLTQCHRELKRRRESGLSVSQIAYAWGFNDQAHFSRAFRRRFDMSPRSV
jgi:AraC-like DNA-binding protein